MNNEHSSPPSQRPKEASRRWFWRNTATGLGAIQAVTTIVLQRHRCVVPTPLRGVSRKETTIARTAPAPVFAAVREAAAIAIDLKRNRLPANATWPYESVCDSLAAPLPYG